MITIENAAPWWTGRCRVGPIDRGTDGASEEAEEIVFCKRPANQSGGWALALEFSPDDSMLALTDEDGNIFILHTTDWITRRIVTQRSDPISHAFNRDGTRFVIGSRDCAARRNRRARNGHAT